MTISPAHTTDGTMSPDGGGRRVLVIDDEPSIRIALSRYFERSGWVVDQAEDGLVALRTLLGEAGSRYVMVISDLKMPGLTGIQLHDRLAAERPELVGRMLFSSGDIGSSDVRAFVARSGRTVLQKPFELGILDEHMAHFASSGAPR